jgi:hypothetical protein
MIGSFAVTVIQGSQSKVYDHHRNPSTPTHKGKPSKNLSRVKLITAQKPIQIANVNRNNKEGKTSHRLIEPV